MQERKEIYAPLTPEQVDCLAIYQHSGYYHPYTYMDNDGDCGSPENRVLLIDESGYTCPCGRYRQSFSWEQTVEAGKYLKQRFGE